MRCIYEIDTYRAQFVFEKEIGKEQIDSIIILQKPIKEFEE